MPKLKYSVALVDAKGVAANDIAAAIEAYKFAVEEYLGGEHAVAEASQEYEKLLDKYGEYPLPEDASDAEKFAADKWIKADLAGERLAFADWELPPGPAHFEIEVWKPHGNTGNQHASKGGFDSHLNIRCLKRDKVGWEKQGKREGMKMSEWVIKTLNAAANNT